MSFTIKLCTTLSDRRSLDKKIITLATLTGTLRDDTSLINPIITIEWDGVDVKSLNYLEISEFKRKYFVQDIKSIRKNIWEIKCHVDVLSSFANEIKSNKAIVKRQENNWNLFLNDNSIKCYQNPHIVTKEFPDGFKTENMSYVLLVAGRPVDGWFDDSNTDI